MPELTIIAGCNGAGKSTFAQSFLSGNEISFDYDRIYIETYNSLPDSELRDLFAQNKVNELFNKEIDFAMNNNTNFCYETNFDEHPIFWAEKFKEKGFKINLVFFCLDNIEIAKERILVRKEFHGHFIDNNTVEQKWKNGYLNVDKYYSFFDTILIVDNSINNEVYKNVLFLQNGQIQVLSSLPAYFPKRLPNLHSYIKTAI